MGTHPLEKSLGYRFEDKDLLLKALTHNSYSYNNYQKLEFLGDSLLDSIISFELYKRYPEASEGYLTRARSNLTRNEQLAKIADTLNIPHHVRVGRGERGIRSSIKADVLESIVAAIHLDGGHNKARKFVIRVFGPYLDSLGSLEELKGSKTVLSEYAQSHKLPLPTYTVVTITGPEHNRTFKVLCEMDGIRRGGKGKSCKAAEQEAAKALLEALDKSDSV